MNRWGKAGSKLGILLLLSVSCVVVAEERVGITKDLQSIRVQHGKEWVEVLRNQDETHQIDENFAKTSRPCPPFCIQPMAVAPGVESVGELELLQFMEQKLPAGAGVLVDARTPDWHSKGTIPGSVNVPYTDLDVELGADQFSIEFSLQQFGVLPRGEYWDFIQAKELLIWCNGPWCGQSPTAIRALLVLGYPADKIKYYRGGMQMWQLMGLPVVLPAKRS
ncbi:MAG: rhodanese-like domain-containing protein [Gammaproteobacteria bacterium]|jgi:rhodanese-related sulfurtransferase|nr:rhodanese-like domain-containing protein [Gammaproteobacteria bacterium]MBT3488783.1 rhodanese-like domain-containing protein [Gammaproteobacteria bacterium]MBT3719140.1 rhodanese-like domain-containing protein [Gammaproteobacteria bacterium]MBT3844538.1 rhodanese-like domain-containing protein [Gammaproteobacteria bacterium]MBT3892400.1 rhodanese-like domain-containing protein [Gammaproteobacteria bacterium]